MKKNDSIKKTNAARMLDQAGIAYELIPYEVDEEHLSADAVAAKLGEDIACVYKTIVPATARSTSRKPPASPATSAPN